MGKKAQPEVPAAKTGMLIRRPAATVFEAFVDPAITSRFWFTEGSGKLRAGEQLRWDWATYDVSVQVDVKVVEPNQRIVIEWPGYSGPTTVELSFTPKSDDATFVSITESGFAAGVEELVKYVSDSREGFALMLAGLKAFLEHGVELGLVSDRFPAGLREPVAR